MSINDAMLAGVTGLIADSSSLSAISDNIANSQTVGYKSTDVAFSTLVTGASLSGDVSAGGVTAVPVSHVDNQGQLQPTSSPTDLGISGNGFFITTQNAASPTTTTPVLFTRAGSFTADSNGYLRNAAGLYLQGWPLDSNGKVLSDPTNLTKLSPINITAIAGAAVPTTSVAVNANLEASQTPSAAAATYNPANAATSMAGDPTANPPVPGITPDVSIQLPVSDSKGTKQTFELDLLKNPNTPNQWYAELVSNPATAVVQNGISPTNPATPPGQVASGIIAFTPTGQYDPVNSTGIFQSNTPILTLGDSAQTANPAPPYSWASQLGDAAQTITFTFGNSGGSGGGLTQFDSPSSVQSIAANGTTFGNLSSVEVSSTGSVTAVFDNGVTREVAQLAIATVPNPDGMNAAPGNAYTISNQSGSATLKIPGSGGAGTISPSTLEASTVDLSTEFTNLIQTQQAYSAASKIITTANEMLTDLLNVIR
jgi:flagellar hook protein FlgE